MSYTATVGPARLGRLQKFYATRISETGLGGHSCAIVAPILGGEKSLMRLTSYVLIVTVLCTIGLVFLQPPQPAVAAERIIAFNVVHLCCQACANALNAGMKKNPAVTNAACSVDRKELTVAFDDTKATPQQLIQTGLQTGFVLQLKK